MSFIFQKIIKKMKKDFKQTENTEARSESVVSCELFHGGLEVTNVTLNKEYSGLKHFSNLTKKNRDW